MPIWLFLCLAFVAANLPWLSDRAFLVIPVEIKRESIRLLEWLVLYGGFLGLGIGLERMTNGEVYPQDQGLPSPVPDRVLFSGNGKLPPASNWQKRYRRSQS